MNLAVQIIAGACVVAGSLLSLAAAIGLFRFPDLLSRMHAASKPQVLGLGLVLTAVVAMEPTWATVTTAIIIMAYQLLTAPVATHMIGRAGYRTKHLRRSMLYRDELSEAIVRAEARNAGGESSREQARNTAEGSTAAWTTGEPGGTGGDTAGRE